LCPCVDYEHIEFKRKAVRKRINESRSLRKSFALVLKHPDEEHKLYHCEACGQLWQASRAWNWGNDEYLFRVPEVKVDQWIAEVFVQPDELLIFTAVISEFLSRNTFTAQEARCNVAGFRSKAVSGVSTCLLHPVEALQRVQQLPENPTGRWFEPYVRKNIVPAL
jgi:hypothetical protein